MLTKSKIALAVALVLGTASAGLAKQYPATAHASAAWQMSPRAINARAEMMRPARPFTWEEKVLFDRASKVF